MDLSIGLGLIGDEALPILAAEVDLTGELDFNGEELPNLTAEDGLGGVYGLGAGLDGLKKSAHSEYKRMASPSVSILLTIARSSISDEKCPFCLRNAPQLTWSILPLLYLSTDLKAAYGE